MDPVLAVSFVVLTSVLVYSIYRWRKERYLAVVAGKTHVILENPVNQLEFVEEPPLVGCRVQKEMEPTAHLQVEKVWADKEQVVMSLAVKIVLEATFELFHAGNAYLLDDERTKLWVVKDGGGYPIKYTDEERTGCHWLPPSGSRWNGRSRKLSSGEIYRFQISFPRPSTPLKDLVFHHPQFMPVQIHLR